MAWNDTIQIIEMIIIVAGCAQHFKRQIANDWRGPMIQKYTFPLKTMSGGEFTLFGIHHSHFAHQLWRLGSTDSHKKQPKTNHF